MCRYSVETVRWEELTTANGTAAHYPEVLQHLRSLDPKTRESAYWQLDNFAVLQGDLYPVAPFAADVLVGMLQADDELPGRNVIYNFLVEVATGWAPLDILSHYDGQTRPLKVACDAAVQQGIETYLHDLSRECTEIRLAVCDLLLQYPKTLLDHIVTLESRLAVEPDAKVQEALRELLDSIQP